jgi:hypothetical protein
VRLKILLAFLTLSVGGFMVIDGVRNLLTGTYFGSSLGPWSKLVSAAGLDPQHFGLVFTLLGLAWFAALAGLFVRARWGVPVAACVGIATLWYVPIGTLFALGYLALVLWKRREFS